MKLEQGKSYVRRDGEVVECVACGETCLGEVAALLTFNDGRHYSDTYTPEDGILKSDPEAPEHDLLREHREARRVRLSFHATNGHGFSVSTAFVHAEYKDGETVEFVEVVK